MLKAPSGATIVGAAGFIGSALSQAFDATGRSAVQVGRHDRLAEGTLLWDQVVASSTVFWCASSINPQIAAEHPERIDRDRTEFSGFLDRLMASGSQARVVLLSSGGTVYGDASTPPFTERSPTVPTSAYGVAKLSIERELLERTGRGLVVRVSNAYGPGQYPAPGQGVIGHWLRALRDGREIVVYGGPEILRDYLYIDDLTEFLLAVHDSRGDLPPVLNVGSGEATSLSTVLAAVGTVSDRHELSVVRHPARPFDLRESWLDVSLAGTVLGWRPRTAVEPGVTAMWRWLAGARAGQRT
ncbi:NAD-dependent epimerase/dehydratase family protein [Sanguibacter suaedae]|uniref:NAD-dependent epimerase/dehydratase family protein n=1 Tax=Sanguibacter suaedae TaxID=2795737 RepID=A0A934M9N3_9MICO|nr:NAD-dependent epimerase/dehydratase family protein [Sanguibacter suaedae]MBI9114775.1 NAD-dependent epimerase/dehydratase family protein [Sanguibacter suaedae]